MLDQIPSSFNRAVIFHRSKAWTDAGSRGYELIIDQIISWSLIHFQPGDAASIRMTEQVPMNRWIHIVVSSDGTGLADGLTIALDGHQAKTEVLRDNLTYYFGRWREHNKNWGTNAGPWIQNGLVDEFRVFERVLSPLEIQECYEPGTLATTIQSKTNFDAISDHLADIDKEVLTHRKR